MTAKTTISAIRFGYGLGRGAPPTSAQGLLAALGGGAAITKIYPIIPSTKIIAQARAMQKARKDTGRDESQMAERRALVKSASLGALHGIARILDTKARFFERLHWFWADHFTVVGKNLTLRAAAPAYLDEAIRPHITGRFADMLKAVVAHPVMLFYLDQLASVGPNSVAGKRRGRGLNENLARELLELHTLGVGAGYGQDDVRQLAELLTGLSFTPRRGFHFNRRISEPGTKIILGKTYGGQHPDLDDIYRALDDLAAHPNTARHLARKLAVHFVSDAPDEALIAHMAAAYGASDGDLMAVYRAMLEHPGAWVPLGQKAKQPFDFMVSALIALDISADEFLNIPLKDLRNFLVRPLAAMGQPFMQARGPDGWPEAAQNWITPQGLATRIAWSVAVAGHFAGRVRDPRVFLQSTLADAAGENLIRAVARTDTVADGVALVLASAEFNRR